MTLLLPFLPAVFAVDGDSDTFHSISTYNADCEDSVPTINPGAQEIAGNLVDEDCDGHDALERFYMDSSFASWSSSSGVSHSADRVTVPSNGFLTRIVSVPARRGHVHAVVKTSNLVGGGCTFELRTSSSAGGTIDAFVLSSGTNVHEMADASATVSPGTRNLTRLELRCDATSSMQVDWVSIQNAGDVVFPPGADVQVSWEDLDITGGGQHNAVRVSAEGLFVAAGDGGGVAVWNPAAAGTSWALASGKGSTGIPSHHRYVADVAAVNWDSVPSKHELFALSGKTVNGDTIGGLWRSVDEGLHWSPLADSYGALTTLAPAYDADTLDCFEGESGGGGGVKLLPDELNEVIYIASHREYSSHGDSGAFGDGVLLWDHDLGLCEPGFDLPTADTVSAFAMIEGLVDEVPMLLVGFRSPSWNDTDYNYNPGLYACQVGEAGLGPSVTCDTEAVECVRVEGTEGWDVRDIEVDQDTGVFYVATGGATSDACATTPGDVYEVAIDAFDTLGTGQVAATPDLLTGSASGFPSGRRAVLGVSLDPTGNYLYATIPGLEEGAMRLTLGTTTWERVGESHSDRDLKRPNMDVGRGWLGGSELEVPIYIPEVRDTEQPIDFVWFTDGSNQDHAVLYGLRTIWDITDLNTSGMRPDIDSYWALTPFVDNLRHDTWGTVGPVDIEADADGNVWMAVPEMHGFMSRSWKDKYPQGGHSDGRSYGAERSCLIERYGADGTSVSVGLDGSVWFSVAQASAGTPHDMGIWKRTLEELPALPGVLVPRYSFQGAGVWEDWERATHDLDGEFNDVLCEWPSEHYTENAYDEGVYDGPLATALGIEADTEAYPNGAFFNGNSTFPEVDTSWGNPRVVAALDSMIAVAAFATYNQGTTDEVSGRLAYTLNGGKTWEEILTAWSDLTGPVDHSCGNMASFYSDDVSLALLKRGTSTYWNDADADGVVDSGEWALDLIVGSNGSDIDDCMMARVRLGTAGRSWQWFDNQPTEAGSAACRVTREGFDGVVGTPWSNEVIFWGGYRAVPSTDPANANGWAEYGGVCSLDLDTGTITSLINPWHSDKTFEYQFADVAPSPNVADVLLVTGRHTPESVKECMRAIGSGPMSGSLCPVATPPLILSRGGGGPWLITLLADLPGSDAGVASAWGTGDVDDMIYLSTEHSGAWKGRVGW